MNSHRAVCTKNAVLFGLITFILSHVPQSASISCGKDSVNVENQLKQSLLCNGYRSEARPRKDPAQTVNLTVSFFVMGYEFDEDDDLLELNVWFNMQWNDEFLVWNRTEWNGIQRMAINSDDIWLPDFRHFSSYYNPDELPDCTNPACSVAWNGSVYCVPRCNMNAKCAASYNRWPFDVHQCNLWYGTWVNSMNEVDMHTEDLCLQGESDFSSPRWSIVSLEKNRAVVKSSDEYMYTILKMDLILVRKNGFDTVAVLCPIMVLAFLNLYIVWLRSSCLERKLLLALSMACHFGFLQQLQWVLPYNRDTVPGLLVFLQSSVIITGLLVVVTLLNCWARAALSHEHMTNASWFGRFMGRFSQNRVAELILAADYLELSYQVTKDESDHHGLQIAKLFDRVIAIACLVTYVVLLLVYIPFGYQRLSSSGVKCMFSFAP
ncbi:neuronal acetylcholine receptor subunit alpha-5-like isoform X1 [Anopheles albimanus]|uniref:neuronal acetylcholine receptor subunit alpha-5-like isoform X1 n=1 Tax=Anopheles albimanus TaxID=7167 RepID=UPI0016415E8F|nr:neuronal acetylcholine receptor subunit alpha-5-like isoform X1 [Anopheles albimanus]